ncbi:MAG: pilus assembly protein PilM [Bacilli bacterium]
MNNEKNVAVIEVSTKSIKFLAGYEIKGKPYVLYSLNKKIGPITNTGKIIDMPRVIEEIIKLSDIQDKSALIHVKSSEVILILPPLGLEVLQGKSSSLINSDNGVISNADIRSLYSFFRRRKIPNKYSLIDIVPDSFMLENESTALPPIGKCSNSIELNAKLHCIPESIYSDYKSALDATKLTIKRCFIAPFAASQALANYGDIPQAYVLVDIGSDLTTVSLIVDSKLFSSRFFSWGGDRINDALIEKFNINYDDAEKYKCLYGYDTRTTSFKAPICTLIDEEGVESKIYKDDFNQVIKSQLESFTNSLNSALNSLLESYPSESKKIPMVLIGGGSQLVGLKEYIEHKIPSDYVISKISDTIGVRNATFFNCLGAIVADGKYKTVYDENHPKVNQVTRNPK